MKLIEAIKAVLLFLIPVHAISEAVYGLPAFVSGWFRTRHWKRLFPASIPLAVSLLLAWSLLVHRWPRHRESLITKYRTSAHQAVDSGDVAAYRLNFRRVQEMSGGGSQLRFEFASTLYRLGEKDEAVRMMSGLAPLKTGDYEPAHRFLASHFTKANFTDSPLTAAQSLQVDLLRAVHLGHVISLNSDARNERLELVKLLAEHRSFDRAEKFLRPTLDKYPEDSLTIARLKARSGKIEAARADARHACEILSAIIEQHPNNLARRIQLAQAHVFLSESDRALNTLCEAIPESPTTPVDSQLAEAISRTYAVWLSLMPDRQQNIQRTCLARLAALPDTEIDADSAELSSPADASPSTMTAVDASDVSFFSRIIASPRRTIVVPFLRGSIAAADGNLPAAEKLLRYARSNSADDPSVNNNLAWTLLQTLDNIASHDDHAMQLGEALQLATRAVETAPQIPEFRETLAQLLAKAGQHELAVTEFRQCLSMGLESRQIHKSLAATLNILGQKQEASYHELESRRQ